MLTKMRSRYAAASVVLILLCGCSLTNQQPPTYVTATPSPTALAPTATEASPTPPPPTITPTPTVPPDVILQTGDDALLNGYYEEAVTSYQTLLQNPGAPADTRATAALHLGQAALREGMFQDALTALTLFITEHQTHSNIAQAYFLRGDAHLGLSQWADAIADFQHYLSLRPGLIDSYVYERIGDAQLALSQQTDALGSYAQALEAQRTLPSQLALREHVAQVYRTGEQYNEALAQYDAILAVAQNAPYKAEIELLAAQTLLDSGDLDHGLARMQHVFTHYENRPEAYRAMGVLLANGRELDEIAQARVSFAHGNYEDAIDALNHYTTSHALTEVPAEAQMILGRAYRELGNNAAAMTAFQTVVGQYPTDSAFGQALLEQGRTKFLAGDIPGAIAHYSAIADNYGYLSEAAEALWRAGYLYGTNDQPDLARSTFERLADRYPETAQARSALFLGASTAYSAGNFAAAERLYGQLALSATGEDQAGAYFMAGKLALARGDSRTADDAFRHAVTAAPDSYYSVRAREITEGQSPFQPPVRYQFDFDEAADSAQAEIWLRETLNIAQEGELSSLSSALEADSRMQRGIELWTLGEFDKARVEFDAITEANSDNAQASYQLAVYFQRIAAYPNAIVASANIIRTAGVGTLDAPPYIARMRYPVYYGDVVLQAAQEQDIDPMLLFSLIRHESLFDTHATAGAGEIGLTQVIPSTGAYIAHETNWPNYQHRDLFRPNVGVAFGAYYLGEQLQRFDGNAVAALAGYNAGPGRTLNWLELSGDDPDLFITAITIDSTRTYVQRIYSYYIIYRALYGVG
jgi:soluble lytic murein transglycosylase